MRRLPVERLLAEADGQAAAAIARLAYGVLFPPKPYDRVDLAQWIALLGVRDPFTRRVIEAMADQTFKMGFSLARSPNIARSRLREQHGRQPTEDEVSELVEMAGALDDVEIVPHQSDLVKMMLDAFQAIFPVVLCRRFAVFRFKDPGLVLSDRPLVLYQLPENRNPCLGVGIANADQLWLPLDRRTALVLHSDPSAPEVVSAGSPELMDTFNAYVIGNAQAEVYCHPMIFTASNN